MTDWKPGDVAMVECSDGEWRRAMFDPTRLDLGGEWLFPNGARRRVDDSNARPLVVIDPEDREQVERLADLFTERHHSSQQSNTASEHGVRSMQAALREFAAPKPPRPEEPTDLRARVECRGAVWAKVGEVWIANGFAAMFWDQLTKGCAVTVLSEGIQ